MTPFFRMSADGKETPVDIDNECLSALKSTCWLIGSGPSLTEEVAETINASQLPKFCMNLAGNAKDGRAPLVIPDYWTAYDPTVRFPAEIYLNPRIRKFVVKGRRMDLLRGLPIKVCECPNVYFFEREYRDFSDILRPESAKVLDCQDTMMQAIDIAYRLGYRSLLLAGTEMAVFPSAEQIEVAKQHGVTYDEDRMATITADGRALPLLRDFHSACKESKATRPDVEGGGHDDGTRSLILDVQKPDLYAFSESKPWQTVLSCDEHYYRVSQWLRLARPCFSAMGLEIVSCTPRSRLNWYFSYVEPRLSNLLDGCNIKIEKSSTAGHYDDSQDLWKNQMPMIDYPPHGQDKDDLGFHKKTYNDRLKAFAQKLDELPDVPLELDE